MPDDFVTVLGNLGSQHAAKHFRASLTTVTIWRRQAGLGPHYRAKRPSRSTSRPLMGRLGGGPRPLKIHRDHTHVGQAADFLKRLGPISRCTSMGKYATKGLFWNRGGHVLSDADVLERAARLGWKPDEL